MLNSVDITYSDASEGRVAIAIAIGIGGEVLITLPTYVDFYEFLLENNEVVCVTEDCSTVNFVKNEEVIETLVTTALMGSVLASNPDILEIVRRNPDNSIPEMNEDRRFKGYVVPGWGYSPEGFIAPEGWVMPPQRTAEEEERAKEVLKLREG
jgi:hypothetical protein